MANTTADETPMTGRKNGDEDANAGKKSPEIEIIRLKLGIWVRGVNRIPTQTKYGMVYTEYKMYDVNYGSLW